MLLYLLTQVTEGEAGSIEIEGVYWSLTPQLLDASNEGEQQFICVSYTWGKGRKPSPFHDNYEVSDRTIPALTATMRHCSSSTRIWIDAFSVPLEMQERAQSLESMGYIYSCAAKVIVVLSNGARPVLDQMSKSDRLFPAHLDLLEKEEWISRAWTYQEAVNSKELYFTCDDSRDVIVDGAHFLNCLGFTLSRPENFGSENDKRQRYPRLDAFEDLIADYQIAGYQERSALQVMSNMDRRAESTKERPEDHFYAMIGAIIVDRGSSSGFADPCQAFMELCERKGDYSFIYSAAKRDSAPSRRWRPESGDLPSILPLHCWGSGQPGHEDAGSFYLDRMMVLEKSPIDKQGEDFVDQWLVSSRNRAAGSQIPLHQSAYTAIQAIGFRGSSSCLHTTKGFFFPFESISPDQVTSVLVATEVRWSLGAPGLARYPAGDVDCYTSGVFFGCVDNVATTSVRVS
jgi:hypothetical protein